MKHERVKETAGVDHGAIDRRLCGGGRNPGASHPDRVRRFYPLPGRDPAFGLRTFVFGLGHSPALHGRRQGGYGSAHPFSRAAGPLGTWPGGGGVFPELLRDHGGLPGRGRLGALPARGSSGQPGLAAVRLFRALHRAHRFRAEAGAQGQRRHHGGAGVQLFPASGTGPGPR